MFAFLWEILSFNFFCSILENPFCRSNWCSIVFQHGHPHLAEFIIIMADTPLPPWLELVFDVDPRGVVRVGRDEFQVFWKLLILSRVDVWIQGVWRITGSSNHRFVVIALGLAALLVMDQLASTWLWLDSQLRWKPPPTTITEVVFN